MKTLVTDGLEEPWTSGRSAVRFAWHQMEPADRVKLIAITAIAASLALLDFVAVLAIGALTAVVAATVAGDSLGLPEWLAPLEEIPAQRLVVLLGVGATLLLVTKSIVAWFLSRRVYLFVGRRVPDFSERIFGTYITASFPAAQSLSLSLVNSAVVGGGAALGMLLTASVAMVTEVVLLTLLVSLLAISSPWLLLASVIYFGLIGLALSRLLGVKARETGQIAVQSSVAAGDTITATVGLAPEIRLYDIGGAFVSRLKHDQLRSAEAFARQQSWFQTPRYVLESAVIVGFTLVAAISFSYQEPAKAVFTMGIFLVTTTRFVPSLLRLNGAWGSLKSGVAQTNYIGPVLVLPVPESGSSVAQEDETVTLPTSSPNAGHVLSSPWLMRLSQVSYRYPTGDEPALKAISLEIPRGSKIALVGSTGSGKSTLALVIAGLIEPTRGQVVIHESARDSLNVAIVPQDVYLARGTIRSNVALAFSGEAVDDSEVWQAISDAQVADLVRSLPLGLDSEVGERGVRLSGGEIQRIGLARALYRGPNLMVLDEATSSLDAETERRVSEAIARSSVRGTVVTVAHRLATVREADLIVLLDRGEIQGTGSFDDMVRQFPMFANAAALQGLLAADKSGVDD